ncbi:MAG: hypothetical protein FD129_794 [bacterium]|nr:MAG: hypothetical protein FD129_794 [bacterium]
MEQEPLPGIELSAEQIGGRTLSANDEFFAPMENLLKGSAPVWKEGEYTERGKWMDGWETRRRREPGHDWCVIRLGLPGVLRAVLVDTAFFRGNFPESFSLEAASLEEGAGVDEGVRWFSMLPVTVLAGNTVHRFPVDCPWRVTHLRLNIFPDGGVARFKAFGAALPDRTLTENYDGRIDLAGMVNGGEVLASSDMFFSDRNNMIRSGSSTHMADGWETKRRRGPGHDWAILRLGTEGIIDSAQIDTTHFKGNAPGRAKLELAQAPGVPADRMSDAAIAWKTLLPETTLAPDRIHEFAPELAAVGPATHARLSIYPDGGVARLRRWINTLPPVELEERLGRCCAAPGWVTAMAQARPFADRATLNRALEAALAALRPTDLLAALRRHPRLGESTAAAPSGRQEQGWSRAEQSCLAMAADPVKVQLARLNAEYEKKFGWIFLLCATGLSAEAVVSHLERRLAADPEAELAAAGVELAAITRLRLERLMTR